MRIVFMGTPDFAVPSLRALVEAGHEVLSVITQPDRPRGRGGKVSFSPVKEAALDLGLPVYQPARVRRPEAVETIRELRPDLLAVVAFGQILPPAVLELPRLGSINVHASLLPRYRGAAPIHWAVINGDTETGVTTMWMDAGLDTGDMILKDVTPIGPDETVGDLHDRLAVIGAGLLAETIRRVETGTAPRLPQDPALATLAPMIRPEHELIDWTRPSAEIHNHIRGMNPWPVAYSCLGGTRIKIWRSVLDGQTSVLDGQAAAQAAGRWPTQPSVPGRVIGVSSNRGILVETGSGAIALNEVQPENSRRMKAEDFARGRGVLPGQIFSGRTVS